MIRIGLTGGIGSGKTTVARVMEQLGVPVYYADERGRWLSDHDPEVIRAISELFGTEVYANGLLNRPYIAGKVFQDNELLQKLNGIIHPAVRRDFQSWAQKQEAPYGVLETAILFESGFDAEVDKIIVVTAPEGLRIARTVKRDGVTSEQVRARMEAQMKDEERIHRADYVLRADERGLLIPQILSVHDALLGE